MRILAIETSCDETAAAIVENGRKLIASVVYSQIDKHRKWGGVIPEMASRFHLECIDEVLQQCLQEAKTYIPDFDLARDIDAIAVTNGPGLLGSLLVGVNCAKTLAWLHQKNIIPVNHLAGHIAANYIGTDLQPPFLCLLVSGGHTQIIQVKSYTEIEVIGETVDDAAGEAFDKVARLMDLPYPGGPQIDKLAQSVANDDARLKQYQFTLPQVENLDFSFSGLKTAALRLKQKLEPEIWQRDLPYIARAFQDCVAEFLCRKMQSACQKTGYSVVVMAGGVAANSAIRSRFQAEFAQEVDPLRNCQEQGLRVRGSGVDSVVNEYAEKGLIFPPLKLCTDNAAMIAAAAYFEHNDSLAQDLSFEVFSRA